MANLDITTKSNYEVKPGVPDNQKVPAAEINSMVGWANSPMKNLGAFDPAMVFDSQGYYDKYTLTEDIVVSATGIVDGQFRSLWIETDGIHSITAGEGMSVSITDFTNVIDAGTYLFMFGSFPDDTGVSKVVTSVPNIIFVDKPTPILRVPMTLAEVDATSYGDAVSQANDIIGTNHFLQTLTVNKGTVELVNSQSWFRATGLGDTDAVIKTLPTSYYQSAFTIAVKFKVTSVAGTQFIFGMGSPSPADRCGLFIITGGQLAGNYQVAGNADGDARSAIASLIAINTEYTVCWVVDPVGNNRINIDGSDITLDGTYDGDMTGVTMGAWTLAADMAIGTRLYDGSYTSNAGDNDIREFRFYNQALTEAQCAEVVTDIG